MTAEVEEFIRIYRCERCGKSETSTFLDHYISGHRCGGKAVMLWYRYYPNGAP